MSLVKKLAGETAIYGVSSILSRLLNYVVLTPYLTRVFLQGQFGVVSDMYAYAALLMVIFTYRMETAFFRFGSREDGIEKTFSTSAISIIFTTILFVGSLLIFAQPVANFLEYPDHRDYIIWFTFIIGFDALAAIPFAKLRLENRPIRFAVVKTLNILVNIFFIFFFLEICPLLIENGWTWLEAIYNSENRIAYVFIANFLGSLSVMLFLLPEYFKIKLKFDKVLWKKMMVYTLPLVVVGIAAVINQLINIPLLKKFLPYDLETNLAKIGVYTACYKIAILMSLFIQAFNYAAEPFFFRHAKRDDSKVIYAQVGQAFAMVGSLVFLGIMSYIEIIQYLIGENFREGLHIVPILLLAFLFLGLYYNFSIWFKLTDRTRIGAYISLGGAVITISLNIVLIPIIEYEGSAWAALACYSFMAFTSYFIGKKYYPIPYPIGRMLLYIGLAVGAYFLGEYGRGLLDGNFWSTIVLNTIILLFYLGTIYVIEKRAIRKILFGKEKA